jgi:hypothetical protein
MIACILLLGPQPVATALGSDFGTNRVKFESKPYQHQPMARLYD